MKYNPRLTKPSKDNKYYNSNINPFVSAGYGMFQNGGNCTCYAFGRAYELLGKKPKLDTGNAERWYKHTEDGYKRGQTPKLGAIACWEGIGKKAGHVAVVEVIENNKITLSNSAWKKKLFYTNQKKSPYSMGSGYKFQGFIYIIDNIENENKEDNKPKETIYVVKKGDNLTKIAKKYNTTWQVIYKNNKSIIGDNPNLIKPGQKLVIK